MKQKDNKMRKIKLEPRFRLIQQMYTTKFFILTKAFYYYILYSYNIFKLQEILAQY